jgi:hypothetical protein
MAAWQHSLEPRVIGWRGGGLGGESDGGGVRGWGVGE